MRFISNAMMHPLLILLLLPSTSSFSLFKEKPKLQTATFVSKSFEMGPGSIASKTFFSIKFPEGHVGIKSFEAELIDEEGNSIPSSEIHLHHWFAMKYHENIDMSTISFIRGHDDFVIKRNEGICNGGILPHYWGFGVESRGTTSNILGPFAVEEGNPKKIENGYAEKWLLNIMAIDTRGAQDKKACSECRCDHMNIPKDFQIVTRDIHNQTSTANYKGGLFCCHDNLQCKQMEGFQGSRRMVSLRYKISWIDWNKHVVPVKVYTLDLCKVLRKINSL